VKTALDVLIEELEASTRQPDTDGAAGRPTGRENALRPFVPLPSALPEAKREPEWPPESEVHAQRFGQTHARLFPLIGKRVWVAGGSGILLSVFAEQCEILPDGANRTVRVHPKDVGLIH